ALLRPAHLEDEVPPGPAAHPLLTHDLVTVARHPYRDLDRRDPVPGPDLEHRAGLELADGAGRADQPYRARCAAVVDQDVGPCRGHQVSGRGGVRAGRSRSSMSHTPCTGEQCRNSGQVMNTTTSATMAMTFSGISTPGKVVHQERGSSRYAPAMKRPVMMMVGSA